MTPIAVLVVVTGGLSVYHLEVGLSDLSCVECDSLAF